MQEFSPPVLQVLKVPPKMCRRYRRGWFLPISRDAIGLATRSFGRERQMSGRQSDVFRAWLTAAVLAQSSAAAATWFPEPTLSGDFATPLLQDLVAADPLGGECIPEERIELAFHATGKGLRLPRTCLPDPCETALTRLRLDGLVGRPVTEPEWDRYFARYADYCRKEVTPFGTETSEPVVTEGAPEAEFWWPLLVTYQSDPVPSVFTSGQTPQGRGSSTRDRGLFAGGFTALGGGVGANGGGKGLGTAVSSSGSTSSVPAITDSGEPTPLPIVPLPTAISALLLAFGSLASFGFWRRRATEQAS